jgi:hypothetical protein
MYNEDLGISDKEYEIYTSLFTDETYKGFIRDKKVSLKNICTDSKTACEKKAEETRICDFIKDYLKFGCLMVIKKYGMSKCSFQYFLPFHASNDKDKNKKEFAIILPCYNDNRVFDLERAKKLGFDIMTMTDDEFMAKVNASASANVSANASAKVSANASPFADDVI